eukprot:jgi/Psemu1/56898/gm1.56898_g
MKFDANIASLLMISHCSSRLLVSAFSSSPRVRTPLAAAASSTLIRMTSSTTDGSTATMAANPMLEQNGLPKFGSVEPKHLTPAVEELLAKLEKDFSGMEDDLAKKKDGGASIEYDE